MTEYQPGVCNIGQGERRKRYAFGVAGFVLAAAAFGTVYVLALPAVWTLTAIVPLFAGFEGVLQGVRGFCAGFAAKGIYDVSDGGNARREVGDDAARRADRRTAVRIHVQSLVGAVVTGAALYLFALLVPVAS
ncbi:hypothetical protein [Salarchaeum sp. JOR-1]|uniref:hypothetical protein n=1 Tax=Salarchaeum sp. JOR-1 TaxID=2599399 RepID=UPI001198BA73|nr:hypothetical protein [Salarchaeum sp. JOR-1]QDX40243.1 hypothetical protein FQU85_04775 [Salarchaeum sp. JOR-1]